MEEEKDPRVLDLAADPVQSMTKGRPHKQPALWRYAWPPNSHVTAGPQLPLIALQGLTRIRSGKTKNYGGRWDSGDVAPPLGGYE